MKHITKIYDENIYSSSAFDFYFKGLRIGVLDIETTGLDPSRNKFILGGLFDLQTKTMHQLFAESRSEEKETLAAFYEIIRDLDMVITYNGRHFDMPFIARRMKALGMDHEYGNVGFSGKIYMPYDLDLYLVVNGHSPIKKLVPNLKQKTVENYMGLWQSRADEISGAESVELYNRYENTGRKDLEEKILLHNSDDVLQLTRLIKVLSKCDLHKAMYNLGFPAGGWQSMDVRESEQHERSDEYQPIIKLMIEKIRTEKDSLLISGTQVPIVASGCDRDDNFGAIDYMGFTFGDWPAETRFERKTAAFTMKLPVIRDSGLCIMDLDAAGIDRGPFEKYPSYSSGFLVIEDHNDRNFLETNHFVKAFIKLFMEYMKG